MMNQGKSKVSDPKSNPQTAKDWSVIISVRSRERSWFRSGSAKSNFRFQCLNELLENMVDPQRKKTKQNRGGKVEFCTEIYSLGKNK